MFEIEIDNKMVMVDGTRQYSEDIEYSVSNNLSNCTIEDCSLFEIRNKTLKRVDSYHFESISGSTNNILLSKSRNNLSSEELLNNLSESESSSSTEYLDHDGTFEELWNCMENKELIIFQYCEYFIIQRIETIIKCYPFYFDLLFPILQNIHNIELEIYFSLQNSFIVAEIFNKESRICYFYDVLKLQQFRELCYLLQEFTIFVFTGCKI